MSDTMTILITRHWSTYALIATEVVESKEQIDQLFEQRPTITVTTPDGESFVVISDHVVAVTEVEVS